MSVQVWFSNDEVEIDPGSSITLTLSVQNLGESTESFTLVPTGLTANWLNVERAGLTLFAGSQDVVDVEITPPMVPSTSAGPTVVGVRVIPSGDPDGTMVAETTIAVRAFDDRRIVALQPVQRARRKANFEFMVENHGNGLASCRLRLIDASERIDGSFDPPAVGVAPGGASLVRLKARARRAFFRRGPRTLDFEVEAEQPGHDPTAAPMSLVQPPTISGAVVWRVLAIAAVIGATAGAWFGVVQPEIESAAEDAVAEEVDRFQGALDEALASGGDVPINGPTTTLPPQPGVVGQADEGEPEFFRLSVSPSLNTTADESYSVPEGQLFDLGGIRIENPNNDGGRAILSINGEEAFVWNLDNIRGSLVEPRLTRIRLDPEDNITFSVRCDRIGDPVVGTCVASVNIDALQVDVDQV